MLAVGFVKLGGSGQEWDHGFSLEAPIQPAAEIQEWHGSGLAAVIYWLQYEQERNRMGRERTIVNER